MAKQEEKKLSAEQFTTKAITALRNEGRKGIHTVYSGYNRAFVEYFGGDKTSPVKATNELATSGKITMFPCKGGAMIYLAGEGPKNPVANTLAKILAPEVK